MHDVTKQTEASGLSYPVTFKAFDSLEEILERLSREGKDPEETLVQIVNAAQEQGAKQGGKEEIRNAIEEHGPLAVVEVENDKGETVERVAPLDDQPEEIRAAVQSHQERAEKYVIGAPRGSTGGVTKTKARELGAALREKLGEEGLLALAREQGIDPSEFGITVPTAK